MLLVPFGQSTTNKTEEAINPWEKYGLMPAAFLYFLRLLALLTLPMTFANILGLTIFNAFPDQPTSKVSTYSN